MVRKVLGAGIILFFIPFISFSRKTVSSSNTGGVKLHVANLVNGQPLQLRTGKYVNANNDSFTVTMFKYYLSNIVLIADNGKKAVEKGSYHLINEAKPGTKEFIVEKLPAGHYKQIRFMIGVDSLHNVSGAQTGQLDPINAMFWDWNTGYIMLKMEGTYLQNNASEIEFHTGGYSGKNCVLKEVVIDLQDDGLNITAGGVPEIFLDADLAELFKTPHIISFAKTPVITTEGKEAHMIADNYADMFLLDHVKQ